TPGDDGHNAALARNTEDCYDMTMVSDYGRIPMKTTIPAGEFKAKCLKLIDEVAEKRKPIVITKYGKPVAQVVPMPAKQQDIVGSMRGSVTILGDIISPLDVEWDAMK
ncbi:MAG: type II toxin-antitoxin system Phd/YefM family antitoxin, partial [Terracidiphilus sp.]